MDTDTQWVTLEARRTGLDPALSRSCNGSSSLQHRCSAVGVTLIAGAKQPPVQRRMMTIPEDNGDATTEMDCIMMLSDGTVDASVHADSCVDEAAVASDEARAYEHCESPVGESSENAEPDKPKWLSDAWEAHQAAKL